MVYDRVTQLGIQGAEVFLINIDRNRTSRTLTDNNGEYVFNMVYPPGIYRIVVTKSGYITAEFRRLSVRINDTTIPVPPIELEPSPIVSTSTVSIDGRSAIVNPSDATRKMTLDPDSIQNLPLSGIRSFDQLALLAPGVFEVPSADGTGPGIGFGVGTSGQFSVNGQRGRNNNFLVDMSDNNDQDVGVRRQGYITLVPQSIESIENYQVISGSYPADFGRNSGSVVNVISKSGGNAICGSAYEYFTYQGFSARNFFDQKTGPVPGKNIFNRHQFGIVISGPFAKDGTFWLGSFEKQLVKDRPEKHFAVPTLAERSFFGHSPLTFSPSNQTDSLGNPLDDLSQYFLNQRIILLGVVGRGVWNLIPMPNNPHGPYGENTYTQQLFADGEGTVTSFKTDHKFQSDSTFTIRYNFTDDHVTIPTTGGAIRSSIRSEVRTQNITTFLNSILSFTSSNQLRFSYGRTRLRFLEASGSPLLFGSQDQEEMLNYVNPGSVFGQILQAPIETDFGVRDYGPFGSTGALGQLIIRPFSPVGVDVLNFPQKRVNNTFQFANTFVQQVGNHFFHFGIDLRHTQQNSLLDRNLRPLADFSSSLGTTLKPLDGIVRGRDLASIGYATGFLQTLIPDFNDDGRADFDTTIGLRFTEANFYVQDNWKITRRLNLNYGLRYEYNSTPSEVNNKIESALADPLSGIPPGNAPPALASFEQNFDSVVEALSGTVGIRRILYEPDSMNLAPRIGIAWDPTGRRDLALRAGYGIYYDQTISAVTSQSRNVFPNLIPLNSSGVGSNLRGLFLTSPQYLTLNDLSREIPVISVGSLNTIGTPAGYFRALIGLLNKTYGQGMAFTLPNQKLASPYAHHFHFTLERELFPELMISLAYVGSRGVHLTRFRSPNGGLSGKPAFEAKASNAFPSFSELYAKTKPPVRYEPFLGAFTIIENSAASTYHSFQALLQGRFTRQLNLTVAYSWSHVIDDVSDVFDGLGFFSRPQSEKTLGTERASANFDVRQRVSTSFIWNIPWGETNPLLKNWILSGIFFARTGQPFTVNTSFDINNDGSLTDRLDTVEGITIASSGPTRLVLPASSIVDGVATKYLAVPGFDGKVGRNTFRTRGVAVIDLALIKNFPLSEKKSVEFRAEIFNLLNRTNFDIPVRILESPGFGRAIDTADAARQVQLAIKVHF